MFESYGLDDGPGLGCLRRGWLEKSLEIIRCSGGAWGALGDAWTSFRLSLVVLRLGSTSFHRAEGFGMEG